ncbi:DUF4144 domain-containing protein [Photobacterium atrarenae]|uniref:DUF4144 domain-containing protein n=1 Tax=Photobacterium atrarenae TaxID=865757 RepID=A0ABY5GNZ2_9GAMM|nr:DUF4144 domain-containing protein [Photobacterium atrarenae]UTV30267.1 DUF4144 domain-containing protein [Photobacterium atrarenae]
MIEWPCVFHLEGDDELIYLASESEFMNETASLIWGESDRVIDSTGQSYGLLSAEAGQIELNPLGHRLTLSEVTALVQAHEFAKAEVCLTKIQFPSISEAISSVS